MRKTKEQRKRSAAAKKGWETRRAIQEALEYERLEKERLKAKKKRASRVKEVVRDFKKAKRIKKVKPTILEKPPKRREKVKIVEVIPPVKKLPLIESELPPERKMKVSREIAEATFDFEADDLEKELKKAVEKLTSYNYSATYRLHTTKDLIIDADLVVDIRPEMDLDEAAKALIKFCPKPPAFFMSIGFILPHPDFETDTGQVLSRGGKPVRRRRGSKGNIRTTSSYMSTSFSKSTLIKIYGEISFNIENKGHKKPIQLFMRLHWNPYLLKPTRSG